MIAPETIARAADFLLKHYGEDSGEAFLILHHRDRGNAQWLAERVAETLKEVQEIAEAMELPVQRPPVQATKKRGRVNTSGKDWTRQRRSDARRNLRYRGYLEEKRKRGRHKPGTMVFYYDSGTLRNVELEQRYRESWGFSFLPAEKIDENV